LQDKKGHKLKKKASDFDCEDDDDSGFEVSN
jgi:hypothetical protein